MIGKKVCLFALFMSGWNIWAQGIVQSSEGQTCLVVTDGQFRKFKEKELHLDVFKMSGNAVERIDRRLCFGGRAGSTYFVKISADGHRPVYLTVEVDEQTRERLVTLTVAVVESRVVSVKGKTGCSQAHCFVKIMQMDGEHVYAIDASGKGAFAVESLRSGKYVIGLQREATTTCALPITVKAWEVDAVEVDLEACTHGRK